MAVERDYRITPRVVSTMGRVTLVYFTNETAYGATITLAKKKCILYKYLYSVIITFELALTNVTLE